MDYCDINDAFNVHSNFEKTIKGFNSFNPTESTLHNIRSGYEFPSENLSTNSLYTDGWGMLNGTDLNSKKSEPDAKCTTHVNSESSPRTERTERTDVEKKNQIKRTNPNYNPIIGTSTNQTPNLTHRECIDIYNNPDDHGQQMFTHALKHISKCSMCENEIKNFSSKKKDSVSKILNADTSIVIPQKPQHSSDIYNSGENQLLDKIDKLLNLVEMNIRQINVLSTSMMQNFNNNSNGSNSQNSNIIDILTTQLLNKKSIEPYAPSAEQNNTPTYIYVLCVGICLVILLLVFDIIMRMGKT